MTHLIALFVFASLTTSTPAEQAAQQMQSRLQSEWQSVIDAEKSIGWQIHVKGRRYEGDWVVRVGSWTYLFAGGKVRCRLQTGEYLSCDNADFVPTSSARIAITDAPHAATLADLKMLQRAIFGAGLTLDKEGKAVIETIVSEPPAEQRMSRRYVANATLTVRGFTIDAPRLVEEYRERCTANHGCHTHWSCGREGVR